MTTAIALPDNTARTFLVHDFGSGLEGDDRFVVERFRALAVGDIRPVPCEAPNAKRLCLECGEAPPALGRTVCGPCGEERRTAARARYAKCKPGADHLTRLHNAGIDIAWLLTGEGPTVRGDRVPADMPRSDWPIPDHGPGAEGHLGLEGHEGEAGRERGPPRREASTGLTRAWARSEGRFS